MDMYIVEDTTPDTIKTVRDRIMLPFHGRNVAEAVQIAIDDCIEKVMVEMNDSVSPHPTLVSRGMKVRPILWGEEWVINFRNGDQYSVFKTTTVPKEEQL